MGFCDEFTSFDQQAIIKVVGIGGGGGNAVGRMIEAGLRDVEFITVNTDAQALKHSPAGTRLQIGEVGLGAGAKPEMGEKAALDDRDRIGEVLAGADMIFLTAGLGGGTGTGATPIVAEIARETGALTVAIVTLPFKFEGRGRMDNAIKGLKALQKKVDALIVVPNERLALLCHENISFLNAFCLADEVLHNGVRAISELITVTGLINLDFADVRTIMRDSGRALMGIGTAEGDKRGLRAAQEAIVCPLLEKSTIDGAMGVIVNVKGGSDMGMKEVLEAVTTVQKAAHPNANIIFGAVVDDEPRPEMQVTVIAAGFPFEAMADTDRYEDAVTLTLEVAEDIHQSVLPQPLPDPEPMPASVTAPKKKKGAAAEQEEFLFPNEDPATMDEPHEVVTINFSRDQEEDMGIPAFMRKRMKRS
ncbi:MAG: cell division protein FtsZ [Candidatus Hydrogenedentes bacterium]|nr:cell division protein FtsZ [Candidatus Hydrogenedentota bacterium]